MINVTELVVFVAWIFVELGHWKVNKFALAAQNFCFFIGLKYWPWSKKQMLGAELTGGDVLSQVIEFQWFYFAHSIFYAPIRARSFVDLQPDKVSSIQGVLQHANTRCVDHYPIYTNCP